MIRGFSGKDLDARIPLLAQRLGLHNIGTDILLQAWGRLISVKDELTVEDLINAGRQTATMHTESPTVNTQRNAMNTRLLAAVLHQKENPSLNAH